MAERPSPPDLAGHGCAVCGAFGAWGFGALWYCGAHRRVGELNLRAGVGGAPPGAADAAAPRQGRLL